MVIVDHLLFQFLISRFVS